jgi:hypothetical protein
MKTPIALIGGLVLTLGAFSPVFAQNTDSTIPQGGNSSASSGSGSWQSSQPNENQDQNENQSQNEGENQNSATEQGNNQGQPGVNAVSASSLSHQESRIGRQIHRLDKNLSDAESYEAEGREDWMSGDTAGARRDFQIAEHILRMATGGGNFEPAMLGGNPYRQEKMVENAIKQAEANGQNVSDAKQLLKKGKDALNNGDMAKASRHFRAAELALGIPVEVGYAEVWESAIPLNARQNGSAESQQHTPEQGSEANSQSQSGNQQTAWNQSQNVKNDINRAAGQGKDVDDAKFLLHDGEQALQNGDQAKAQRDFRAAERALSMNETGSYSNPSNQNSSANE